MGKRRQKGPGRLQLAQLLLAMTDFPVDTFSRGRFYGFVGTTAGESLTTHFLGSGKQVHFASDWLPQIFLQPTLGPGLLKANLWFLCAEMSLFSNQSSWVGSKSSPHSLSHSLRLVFRGSKLLPHHSSYLVFRPLSPTLDPQISQA